MGVAKTRAALLAEIQSIITDGGGLTATEHREILDDLLTSMVNINDDIVPSAHSASRAYLAGQVCTFNNRLLICHTSIVAKTFAPDDWWDVDEFNNASGSIVAVDIASGGSIDLAALDSQYSKTILLTCTGASQSITDITGAVSNWIYKFQAVTGKTITFNHTTIASASSGQMVNKGGANLAIVGRDGEKSDYVKYKYDGGGDVWMELDSAIYP